MNSRAVARWWLGLVLAAGGFSCGAAAADTAKQPEPAFSEARQHHYLFAHRFLPRLFYREPAEMMARLSEEGAAFVTELWTDVGARLDADQRVAPAGIAVQVEQVDATTQIAWVTMPLPLVAPEAYFAALVVRPGELHYYTFECGMNLESGVNERVGVLCGWDADGKHHDYGSTRRATLIDFKASVRAHLTSTASGHPAAAAP